MTEFLKNRQVGDTSPFAFQAVDGLTRAVLDISDDDTFWMDMILRTGATVKINRAVMTKDRANGVVTYMPASSEVDTAGVYTVQIYCLRPDGERMITAEALQRLVANARALDFTPP